MQKREEKIWNEKTDRKKERIRNIPKPISLTTLFGRLNESIF
jgi:hypothetical protein